MVSGSVDVDLGEWRRDKRPRAFAWGVGTLLTFAGLFVVFAAFG